MSNHGTPAPTWLNAVYLETILKNHFSEPHLKVLNFEVVPGSKEGDNFASQIYRIKLLLNTNDSNKQLSIIAKIKPNTKTAEEIAGGLDIFEIEAAVFDNVIPAVKNEMKNIKAAKRFAPECFHVDHSNQAILMEDLVEKNFVLQPRGQFLSKEQALLVMEAYATLHGASFKVVEKDPSLKKTFERGLLGSKPNEVMDKWYENGIHMLDKHVDSYGMSEDWCRRIRDVGKRLKTESLKVCDIQERNLNVLRHGDPWMNNMMFHFSDGVPDDVILLDFQLTTYNSFSHDLQFFLFSSVDADVLVNNLDTLLETYFNKLRAVAPEVPNLTFDRVKSEFANAYFLGCVVLLLGRAFICSAAPPDMDGLVGGQPVQMGFNDPRYVVQLKKLLPVMERAGVF